MHLKQLLHYIKKKRLKEQWEDFCGVESAGESRHSPQVQLLTGVSICFKTTSTVYCLMFNVAAGLWSCNVGAVNLFI